MAWNCKMKCDKKIIEEIQAFAHDFIIIYT